MHRNPHRVLTAVALFAVLASTVAVGTATPTATQTPSQSSQSVTHEKTYSGAHRILTRPPKKPKPPPKFHPNGRFYTRRAHEDVLLSGTPPDPWFAAILLKEPEDLTLDEVEDMTELERIDYVGRFDWTNRKLVTNTLQVLHRMETLSRMKHRRRPGDQHEDANPLHDDIRVTNAGLSRHTIGTDEDGSAKEEEELDSRMSKPRWHLEGEHERIATDPVWQRRTVSRRPTVHEHSAKKIKKSKIHGGSQSASASKSATVTETNSATGTASSSFKLRNPKKKVAVIPKLDDTVLHKDAKSSFSGSAAGANFDHRKVQSTVKRRPKQHLTTREERDAKRASLRTLSAHEQLEQHHQEDPGRCTAAASLFCGGLTYHFAEFLNCTLNSLHKFEAHDEHCVHEFKDYFSPCAADMLAHCTHRSSFQVVKCVVDLARKDLHILEAEAAQEQHDDHPPHPLHLSERCLASEYMEAMISFKPDEKSEHEPLPDKELRTLLKYQQFWLSQHPENLDEEEEAHMLEDIEVKVYEEGEEPQDWSQDDFASDDAESAAVKKAQDEL